MSLPSHCPGDIGGQKPVVTPWGICWTHLLDAHCERGITPLSDVTGHCVATFLCLGTKSEREKKTIRIPSLKRSACALLFCVRGLLCWTAAIVVIWKKLLFRKSPVISSPRPLQTAPWVPLRLRLSGKMIEIRLERHIVLADYEEEVTPLVFFSLVCSFLFKMKAENTKRPVVSKYPDVCMSENTSEIIQKYYRLGHLAPGSVHVERFGKSSPAHSDSDSSNEPHSGVLNSCSSRHFFHFEAGNMSTDTHV